MGAWAERGMGVGCEESALSTQCSERLKGGKDCLREMALSQDLRCPHLLAASALHLVWVAKGG